MYTFLNGFWTVVYSEESYINIFILPIAFQLSYKSAHDVHMYPTRVETMTPK